MSLPGAALPNACQCVRIGRMFARFLVVPLLLAPIAAQAQQALPPVVYPAIPATASTIAGFVPRGWRLEMAAKGDLDGDGRPDLALLLRGNDPAARIDAEMCDDPLDTNPRMLVVAFAVPGGYRRIVANHRLIPRRENPCEMDWIEEGALVIARGSLSLNFQRMMSMGGWSAGTTRFTFRWQADALRLIGWDYSHVARNSGETATISINYLTRRVKTETGRIDADRSRVRWSVVPEAPLLTLDQIGDALALDPGGRIGRLP
jgi:hypothetical protein